MGMTLIRGIRRGLRVAPLAALLTALGLSIAPTRVGHAAAIVVNTTADELNSDGDCSLREAIQAANTNSTVDQCVHDGFATPDTISFAAGTNGTPIVLVGGWGDGDDLVFALDEGQRQVRIRD